MKHFLTKRLFLLLGLSLTIACSSDDEETVTITNLSFTAVASGAGNNVVTVTPSSTGGTSYSVDFGTNASDDVTVTAGPGVSYTYPEVDASYTIVVTASATDAINATSEQIVAVDFNEPIPSVLEGTWVFKHIAEAINVGPAIGSGEWFKNSLADVVTRACLFDDQFIFNADGTYANVVGESTWLEPDLNGVSEEKCGTPQAPFDGTATATWNHDDVANTITINGVGAFLGLTKLYNLSLIKTAADAKEQIIYNVVSISDDKNTLVVEIEFQSAGFFTMTFAKSGSAGASLPTTDTDGDGKLDYEDSCPTVSGTGTDGCPVVTAPTTAPSEPTLPSSDVVSIFSDAYTDLEATWNPGWGQTTASETEIIANNTVRKYTALNFSGIDFGSNKVDLTAVTTVTFDYWTPNLATLKLKLVDFGVNADLEPKPEGIITISAPVLETWTTVTVSLSDVEKITADGKIGQLVWDGGSGSEVLYIDNLYFY